VKLRRTHRNLVESKAPTRRRRLEGRAGFASMADTHAAKQRAIADELRHHDPFGRPELFLAHEATLLRLRAAS
jgi:hypothetical protein